MQPKAHEKKRGAALTSSFVGRRAELESLEQLLQEKRLLTILGPPGVGKTRLVLEYMFSRSREAQQRQEFWFCDLTDVRSIERFWSVVAQAIGAPQGRWGTDAAASLGASLSAQGESILVLDNFEQLVPHAAETVGELLGAALTSHCIVTSRERLRLPGESLIELRPLPLPTDHGGTMEALRRAESVQLFLERTKEVRPDYRLTAKDASSIVTLVRELDGLPLAIELAAARMRVLSPPQILKNLDRRFQLLSTSRHEGSPCKKTLWAAIDRSWELLLPFEQTALAECSVFRGGFSLEAAEQILDLSSYPEAAFPLDVLQSLCDKSLLYYDDREEPRGEPRYSLYRSVREYASQRLEETGRGESAKRRHAAYFVRVIEGWVGEVYRSGRAAAERRLSPEVENLLSVHRRALRARPLSAEDAKQALLAALALNLLLGVEGPMGFYISLLDAAIEASARVGVDPRLSAEALNVRGAAFRVVGRLREALQDHEEARALAEEHGDRGLFGRAQNGVASTLCLLSRFDEARACHEAALASHREVGARRFEGVTYSNLGFLEQTQGNLSLAREHYERALAILREIGDRGAEGLLLNNLASLEVDQRKLDVAERHLHAGLLLLEEVGDRQTQGLTLANLGVVEQERQRFAEARRFFEQAARIFHDIGDARFEGIITGAMGICEQEEGRLAEARASYARALPLLHGTKERAYEGIILGYQASLAAIAGQEEEARATFEAAEARLRGLQNPVFRAAVALCRGHLDLSLSREASDRGDEVRAEAHLEAARQRLNEILAGPGQAISPASLMEVSAAVRTAARMLREAVSQAPPALSERRRAEEEERSGLLVAESGRWFQAPEGSRISLTKRRTLQKLLRKLAAHRAEAPGEALPLRALFEAGWPGEKVGVEVAANRVYTALWMLKKLGLRDVLLSRDDGYLLDPSRAISLSPDSS